MPDYFVPLDTSMNTEYFRKLFYNNVIREYTLKYYENNRTRLEKMNYDEFYKSFKVNDKMLQELVRLGSDSGVDFNEAQFETSKELIKTRIKAQIARSVWQSEGYYPVFNQTNEIFLQGMKLFEEARQLAAN